MASHFSFIVPFQQVVLVITIRIKFILLFIITIWINVELALNLYIYISRCNVCKIINFIRSGQWGYMIKINLNFMYTHAPWGSINIWWIYAKILQPTHSTDIISALEKLHYYFKIVHNTRTHYSMPPGLVPNANFHGLIN